MKENQPLVSICAPNYNKATYLDNFFESIMWQTYQNLELVLVEDRSTDNSLEIINKWIPILESRGIFVNFSINEKNLGCTKNMNIAIKKATGEFIKWNATDDYLLPTCIEKMVHCLQSTDSGVCVSNGYWTSHTFKLRDFSIENKFESYYSDEISLFEDENLFYYCVFGGVINACAFMYKRSVHDKIGFIDTELSIEDGDFLINLSYNYNFSYCSDKLMLNTRAVESHGGSPQLFSYENRFARGYMGIYNKYHTLLPDDFHGPLKRYYYIYVVPPLMAGNPSECIYDLCNQFVKINLGNDTKLSTINIIKANYIAKKSILRLFANTKYFPHQKSQIHFKCVKHVIKYTNVFALKYFLYRVGIYHVIRNIWRRYFRG